MTRRWITRWVWLVGVAAFAISTGCIPSCNIPQRREAHRRLPAPPPYRQPLHRLENNGEVIPAPELALPPKAPGIGFEWKEPDFWLIEDPIAPPVEADIPQQWMLRDGPHPDSPIEEPSVPSTETAP